MVEAEKKQDFGEKELPKDIQHEIKQELISEIEKKRTDQGQEIFIEDLPYWTRVAILEDGKTVEILLDLHDGRDDFSAGNIYKGKIVDVVPSMQAVFINIGSEKNAYLFVPSKNKIEKYKSGDEIIVQIKKESIDSKGAKVSDNPTIPGKYVVLTMEKKLGISKKILSHAEKARIRKILAKLESKIKDEEIGIVARTEAQDTPEELIEEDFERLLKVYYEMKEKIKNLPAPALLWSDSDIIRKAIRDYSSPRLKRVVSNSEEKLKKAQEYIKEFIPGIYENVKFELSDHPFVFQKYGIEEDFQNALKDEIEIEGGIKLIFNETEAFTAIDVNTASFTGTESLDITAYQANIISAKEIIRQLRLRKIGGIIIVDFIDIKGQKLKKKFFSEIKRIIEKDKERTKVFGITKLGLVEISRKKSGHSLKKILMSKCPTCGNGYVHSDILKIHETILQISKYQDKIVKVSPENFKTLDDIVKKLKLNVRLQPKYGLEKWEVSI
jgi:Rne/Rng family ribonuclease